MWQIPGSSAFAYRGEWMHTAEEGVLINLHASAMHNLLDGVYGGHAAFALRVDDLWNALRRHFPRAADAPLRRLTVNMLGGPHADYPTFGRCKASASKGLVTPMLNLLRETSDGSRPTLHRIRAYECLQEMFRIIDIPGLFMAADSADALWSCANEFVQHYAWLANHHAGEGRFRCNPTFKMHWLLHIAWHARFLHPRATWTYSFEDVCGKAKRLAIACMHGIVNHDLAPKVLKQHLVALHGFATW